MELFPKYCENIIVGVIYKKDFSWYVTERNLWYLDYNKYYDNLKQRNIEMGRSIKRFEYEVGDFEHFCGGRWGIKSFNSYSDVDKFLIKIDKYKVSNKELKEYRNIADKDEIYDFYPVLLIDFDKKVLYNYIQEPFYFHEFVPNGWEGKYENFYSLIPGEQIFY